MKAAVAPGLLVLLAGCVTTSAPVSPLEHPAEYQCQRDWQMPESRFIATAMLAEDGRLKSWHLTWLRFSTNYALVGWGAQFDFEGPRLPAPEDDWRLMLRLDGFAPGTRTVHVELFRGGVDRAEGPALAVARARGANSLIFTYWRRDAIRTALAGAPELIVRVIDRRGRKRLLHRLPSAMLDGPAEAVTARRGALEGMIADYRNQCEFRPAGGEIVVT
jgi:hypothetical protein